MPRPDDGSQIGGAGSTGPGGLSATAAARSDRKPSDADTRLPVLVLTGFLGSGKTTLLNRLLAQAAMRGSAVAINEFGEVGIDGDLIRHAPQPQAVLAGGCFCCSLGATFGDELLALYSRAAASGHPVDRLIVETTGIGEPSDLIGFIIGNPAASRLFRLETIACTVDALFAERYIGEYPEAVAQIAIADVLLITKPDLAATADIPRLQRVIAEINPRAEVVSALHGDVPADRLIAATKRDCADHPISTTVAGGLRSRAHGESSHGVTTFTLCADRPIERRAFSQWLTSARVSWGRDLLRAKGVVYLAGERYPLAIHGVQHVFHRPEPLPQLVEDRPRSRLTFIARGPIFQQTELDWKRMVMHDGAAGERGLVGS